MICVLRDNKCAAFLIFERLNGDVDYAVCCCVYAATRLFSMQQRTPCGDAVGLTREAGEWRVGHWALSSSAASGARRSVTFSGFDNMLGHAGVLFFVLGSIQGGIKNWHTLFCRLCLNFVK